MFTSRAHICQIWYAQFTTQLKLINQVRLICIEYLHCYFFQIGVKRTKRSEPGHTLPYTPEVNSYNAPPAQVHHGDNAYAPIPPYPHVQPYHAAAQSYHPVQPYYKPKEIKFDDAPEMVYGWVIRTRSFTPCKGEIKKECDRLERENKVIQCNIPRFR